MKKSKIVLAMTGMTLMVATIGLNAFPSLSSSTIVEAASKSSASKPISVSKYGTVTKENYKTWNNFEWSPRGNTKDIYQSTVFIKYQYNNSNGYSYYSIYDQNNTWLGYVNKDAVKFADGKQGLAQKVDKTVQVTTKNYPIHQNFSWKKKTDSKTLKNKPLTVKYLYRHINGSTYYSLYDKEGTWQGYINKDGVKDIDLTKPAQGDAIKVNKYATVVNFDYNTYQNFGWEIKNNGLDINGQTFKVKYEYHHRNDSVYYSLYDQQDNWQGYINEKGTKNNGAKGTYYAYNKYVDIKDTGAVIQKELNKLDGDTVMFRPFKRPILAKGMYHHFNGKTYYSLYDKIGIWQGYAVEDELDLDVKKSGRGEETDLKVRVSLQNQRVYKNFNWDVLYETNELLGKEFNAKRVYYHINDLDYYSLFDKDGKWYGYINTDFVTTLNPSIMGVSNTTVRVSDGDFDPLKGIWAKDRDGNKLEITVEGSVDLKTPGAYTLKYTVVDSKGLQTTASRVVRVVDGGVTTPE